MGSVRRRGVPTCAVLVAALSLALGAGGAPAQEAEHAPPVRGSLNDPEAYPRPVATAARTGAAPTIDGVLDEPAWRTAELITDFIQSRPEPGRLALERTEVRILYDDEALYIGAICYDSDPGAYVIQSMERDFPSLSTRDADIFGFTLDTFLARKNSFIFSINPLGAYRDGQTFDDSRSEDFGFDVPAEVETFLRDDGWSLEVRIPWSGLRYDASRREQVFGLNMHRRVRRTNEDAYWAPLQQRDPSHRMSKAGTLYGIRDLPASQNLSAKPYLSVDDQAGSAVAAGAAGTGRSVGGDLKYGITPGLTLDMTVNTDFSQVDVDQEQVNLTRFPLFFPEQRDF
ncbi:MAG: carbohydrate binding family 9 domain-containing protein, partial [Gemmatimonadetes bacterium]|nr:carbohydrate binding family 9 domain-containing protein [Gemmatimonadota bacterium]